MDAFREERTGVTQTFVLQQDGGKVTGTFTGPRQSGTIDVALSGNAIKLHVTAKMSIHYTGTVEGDIMRGTFTSKGESGEWTGTRTHLAFPTGFTSKEDITLNKKQRDGPDCMPDNT
jgi:hypothetical protein